MTDPTDTSEALQAVLRELLDDELGHSLRDLGARWAGGRVLVRDAQGTVTRDLSLRRFFQKLVHLRSALDGLEQALAQHGGLADLRAELAESIVRMRGTLTTFNLLFTDKEDYF